MFNRPYSEMENKFKYSELWQTFENHIMLEDLEGYEGEIIVHAHVHKTNKYQIFNGMYTCSNEPYLMLVHRPNWDDESKTEFFTYRNLTQVEEDLQIAVFLKLHNLSDELE